ncbi:TPA: structural protein, partial [Salmonella enterica]|nr:structural protein [Salmonella enterica]
MSDSNINYRHPAYSEFLPEWQMVGDCVDGERAVKKQREKYLPHPGDEGQNSEQDRERYKAYLKRAPFINATGRTLTGLIGIA